MSILDDMNEINRLAVDITNVRPIIQKKEFVAKQDPDAILILFGKRYDLTCEIMDIGKDEAYQGYLLSKIGKICINGIFDDEEITEMVEE